MRLTLRDLERLAALREKARGVTIEYAVTADSQERADATDSYVDTLFDSADALLALARRAIELEGALEFLAMADGQRFALVAHYRAPGETTYDTRASAVLQVAKRYGWSPDGERSE